MIKSSTIKKDLVVLLIFTTLPFFISLKSFAQPNLIFAPVVNGLIQPCDVVNAADGTNRLFVACLPGNVRIVRLPGGTLDVADFLDIPDSTDNFGEGGLLSIAFHPNFKNNRYFFVYYTTNSGDLRITRFQTFVGNPDLADETTGQVILTIPHPTNNNHNGGKLNFGPDGNLYIGTGDGGGTGDPSNNAQSGNSLLGKMLRINVDDFLTPPYYTIPPDNPYIADINVLDEIYNLGMRNPWRCSFDRTTGDVWIADVGQSQREEINYTPLLSAGGLNYGWRCYEGTVAYNTAGCQLQSFYFSPIHDYDHTLGHSVTGGYVYRGVDYHVMNGYYICADYILQRAWLIKPNGPGLWTVTTQTLNIPANLVGFGESENGAVYALSLTNGILYKITTNTPYLPLTLLQFTGKAFAGYNELKWKTTNEQNLSHYEIEFSSDGVNYAVLKQVSANNGTSENNYSFQHFTTAPGKSFYRIKNINIDGSSTYSNVITLDNKEKAYVKVYPTLITNDRLTIISGRPVEQVIFFSADGKAVFQTRLNNLSGTINIPLPRMQKGLYMLQLKLKDEYVYEKVLIQQE